MPGSPVVGTSTANGARHRGLTSQLDCIEMCTNSWNHYLASLREYLETGSDSPFGSEADTAWRREAAR